MMRTTLGFVAVALLSLVATSAQGQGNMRQPLNQAERARLARGEVVVRPTTERRGPLRLFGGTSYILVDLPVDSVWRALNDHSRYYRHMLPQVAAAREVARNGNIDRVIQFRHDVGVVNAGYSLRFEYDATAKTVMFRLDPGRAHDIRAAWGFFRLQPRGQGQTLVSFGAMVDVGNGLISGALQSRLHEWVLKIPWTFKRYIEGSRARSRYAPR